MDKFPEAFRRYEDKIDIDSGWSFQKLLTSFGNWSKDKWKGSKKQKRALGVEAELIGIEALEKQQIRFEEKFISYVNKYGTLVQYTQKSRTQEVYRNVVSGKYGKSKSEE